LRPRAVISATTAWASSALLW